ncbi:MAG: sarcinarray family MAST domain-containing protein, partial [ANME-2 cluster archaeon]|nr:sarcinarray family MAST domain-containing protein [ANME-2 cluster archaeon]
KIQITSKIEGDLAFLLTNPMVKKPYYVTEGPSEFEEWLVEYEVNPGWTKTYVWKIAPNDKWTNGNAPINVLVQINDGMDYRKIEFTIANPYILDEQYSGPTPTHTPTDPSSTDQPPGSNGLPGFGVVGMMIALTLVLCSKRWLF